MTNHILNPQVMLFWVCLQYTHLFYVGKQYFAHISCNWGEKEIDRQQKTEKDIMFQQPG